MFSNLYPRLGYHQIKIKEGDVPKIAFRTVYDHYEAYVIWTHQCPCGIHRINESSIQGVSHTSVIVFIDDIFVYSNGLRIEGISLENPFDLEGKISCI